MPYIGKNPVGGGFHKLDALTASATATYALTLNSTAYYPESANQLLVSLNGVIQAPQDSFTVSGSNLVFDTALTTSDSIDFVVALGDVLAVKTVTDGAITTAKLGNGAVTRAKMANDLSGTDLAIDTTSSTFKMTDLTSNAFYRTGTWTPYYSSAGATTAYESDVFTSASYLHQIGTYTRIGDMVFAHANITLDYSAAGYQNGGASGQALSVSGLPFKAKNTNNYYPTTSAVYFSVDPAQGWGSYNLVGFLTFNEKYIRIRYSSGGGTVTNFSTGAVYDTVGGGATDSTVFFNIAYRTDEA